MEGGERIITDSKYRAAPDSAMTHKEDHDTPVQPQSDSYYCRYYVQDTYKGKIAAHTEVKFLRGLTEIP